MSKELRKRRIVLGVTGSIAATKAQSIALALQAVGFEVRVCLTHSALKVINEPALSSVISEKPYTEMWTNPKGFGELHIEWAEWADVILIAPATASCISDLWNGSYNSTVTLVAGCLHPSKWVLAPAMADSMWNQPPVVRNVQELKDWGVNFLGPVKGKVASGAIGWRLMEPRQIAEALDSLVHVPSEN